MKRQFVFFLLLLSSGSVHAQLRVPYDPVPVMIDGRFGKDEWKRAAAVRVNDSTFIYLKQDKRYIYWCLHIKGREPVLAAVDFYMQTGDTLRNLHASAKLGERTFSAGRYGVWNWWNNEKWWATVSRIDKYEQRTFKPDEVKEFQLDKNRFTHKEFKLMFEMVFPAQLIMKFPIAADTTKSASWLALRL